MKQQKSHVKIGDRIKIIAGDKRGTLGNIISINKKKCTAIIDSVKVRVKSLKKIEGKEAEKINLQIPIQLSNLMLWDIEANLSSRIGYKFLENKKKRYFKKSGNIIEKLV